MVFKNGELLRTYYLRVDLVEILHGASLTFHFTDFRDENGNAPDVAISNQGGGEIYEFKQLDLEFTDTTFNRDIQIFKINAFGYVHELLIFVGSNAQYLHYDKNDFRSSITRMLPAGINRNINTMPGNNLVQINTNSENWRFYIAENGAGDNYAGELRLTLVVRVH